MFYLFFAILFVIIIGLFLYDQSFYRPVGLEFEFIPKIIDYTPKAIALLGKPHSFRARRCSKQFKTSRMWQFCLNYQGWCGIPFLRKSITRKGSLWGVIIKGEVYIFRPQKMEELRKEVREKQLSFQEINPSKNTLSSLGHLLKLRMIAQELQFEDIEYIFRVDFKETEQLTTEEQNPISYTVQIVFFNRIEQLCMKLIESILKDRKAKLLYTDGGQNSNEPNNLRIDELSFN
jgi:hypothetical protein